MYEGWKNVLSLFNRPLLLIFLLALTNGCAVSPDGPSDRSHPEWVKNPPSDDAGAIRGVGQGNTIEEARGNALGVIAGKLKTRVQAELETEQVLEDGEESSFTRNRVQTTTESLGLSDYEVLKTASSGDQQFVLVEVDRSTLVQKLKSELETMNDELQATLGGAEQASLTRLHRLNRSEERIREALALVSLIASVDKGADLGRKRSRYNALLSERQSLLQSLRVAVENDAETSVLGDRITRMLLDRGIHTDTADGSGNYNAFLRISGETNRSERFGEKHVHLKVKFHLVNDNGESVTTARYEAGASSLSNYASARDSANRVIADRIKTQGIWKALKLREGQ